MIKFDLVTWYAINPDQTFLLPAQAARLKTLVTPSRPSITSSARLGRAAAIQLKADSSPSNRNLGQHRNQHRGRIPQTQATQHTTHTVRGTYHHAHQTAHHTPQSYSKPVTSSYPQPSTPFHLRLILATFFDWVVVIVRHRAEVWPPVAPALPPPSPAPLGRLQLNGACVGRWQAGQSSDKETGLVEFAIRVLRLGRADAGGVGVGCARRVG